MQLHPIVNQDIQNIIKHTKSDLQKLSGKNILITGASGMIARYMVYTLIQANDQILKKPAHLYLVIRGNKKPFGNNKNITYLNLDIAKKVPKVKNIHYIIHAASKSAPKHFLKEPVDTISTNILGTYNLLDRTDKNLKNFLFISSGAIYGESTGKEKIDEEFIGRTNHLNPKSCYTIGKMAGESILINYYYQNKIPISIARLFHTFGPGLNLSDGRVFSDMIKNAVEGKNITIKGNANVTRPFLYLSDATVMLIKILTSLKKGQVYNIANDRENHSVSDFASITAQNYHKITGKKIQIVQTNNKNSPRYKNISLHYRPSIDKFVKEFGWRPKTSTKEAVERTIRAFR